MLKPYANSMLKGFLALAMITVFSSCEKDENFNVTEAASEKIVLNFKNPAGSENFRIGSGLSDVCGLETVNLVVGQKTSPELGKVSVYKDQKFLYVTLSIDDNDNAWFIAKTHLFIGAITSLGVKKNPAPGQFPESAELVKPGNAGDKEYTYKLELDKYTTEDGTGNLDFAVHADLVRVKMEEGAIVYNADGTATIEQKEGAWGDGVRFTDKGSWASYFQYDVDKECSSPCNPVFKKLTGDLVFVDKGNDTEAVDIQYPLFNNNEVVGKVTVQLNRSGVLKAIFTLTDTSLSFEEIAFKWEYDSNDINTDFSSVHKVTQANDKGVWEIQPDDKIEEGKTIYPAVYAKLKGVCP